MIIVARSLELSELPTDKKTMPGQDQTKASHRSASRPRLCRVESHLLADSTLHSALRASENESDILGLWSSYSPTVMVGYQAAL